MDPENNINILHAAIHGRTDLIRQLFFYCTKEERHALLNQRDNFGYTAFILAAAHGHTETLIELLTTASQEERLILLDQADNRGNTASILATIYGHTETLDALFTATDFQEYRAILNYFSIAMFKAMENRRIEKRDFLLANTLETEHATLLRQCNDNGMTAFMAAALTGRTAILCALFNVASNAERSFLLAQTNIHGDTAIVLAFKNGHHHIVAELQKYGAILPPHLQDAAAEMRNVTQSTHTTSMTASQVTDNTHEKVSRENSEHKRERSPSPSR